MHNDYPCILVPSLFLLKGRSGVEQSLPPLAFLLPPLDLQDHFGRKQAGNHSHCIEAQ